MVNSSDLPNLDLLRASAVLLVLFDHTFQAVAFKSPMIDRLGLLGVLFFFVHTCCVLMMSLERQQSSGEPLARNFYIRRAFRIYPLSIVAVLAACVGPHATKLGALGWIANLALVQNLTYSVDAFGSIWTLPLEVQMYVFLPALFLLAKRTRTIVPLLAVWVLTAAVAQSHIYRSDRLILWEFMPCFLPGVMAYWLFDRCQPKLRTWMWPVALAVIIAGYEFSTGMRAPFFGSGWHLSAWIACLALGLGVPFFAQISNKRFNVITLTIAKYSYGIYLSHSLLLKWMAPTYRTLPLYLGLVALMAWLGFRYIEHPMIQYGKRFTRRPKAATRVRAIA